MKITASELRIGNLVEYPQFMMQLCVESISNDCVNYTYEIDGCIGIPLTEEWLIKFGFKNMGDKEHPNYKKEIYSCMWRCGRTNICNNHGFIKNLKYVHQLQNLYFELTGKELTRVK